MNLENIKNAEGLETFDVVEEKKIVNDKIMDLIFVLYKNGSMLI